MRKTGNGIPVYTTCSVIDSSQHIGPGFINFNIHVGWVAEQMPVIGGPGCRVVGSGSKGAIQARGTTTNNRKICTCIYAWAVEYLKIGGHGIGTSRIGVHILSRLETQKSFEVNQAGR